MLSRLRPLLACHTIRYTMSPQPISTTAEAAKPPKEGKKSKGATAALTGQMAALELSPPPDFFKHRMDMFDRLLKEYNAHLAAQPRETIEVSLPNGSTVPATTYETCPMDIAKSLSGSSNFGRTPFHVRVKANPSQKRSSSPRYIADRVSALF
jgi:hypothetical protein